MRWRGVGRTHKRIRFIPNRRTPNASHTHASRYNILYYFCSILPLVCTGSTSAFPGIGGSASFCAENLNLQITKQFDVRTAHMTQISFKSLIVAFSFGNERLQRSNWRIYFYCVAECRQWSAGNMCTRYQHRAPSCVKPVEAIRGCSKRTNTQSLLFYRMRVNSFINTRSVANEIVE